MEKEKFLFFFSPFLVAGSLFFFFAFPFILLDRMEKDVPSKKILKKEDPLEFLRKCIREPFQRQAMILEYEHGEKKDQIPLSLIAQDPKNSPRVRLEALLVLSELSSPYLEDSAFACLSTENSALRDTAIQKIGQVGGKKVIPLLLELLGEKRLSLWTRTLILKALHQIRDGDSLSSGQMSEEDIQISFLLWKTWWKKNKDRSPLEWYEDLFSQSDPRSQEKAMDLMGHYGLKSEKEKTAKTLLQKGILGSSHPSVILRAMQWFNRLSPHQAAPHLRKIALYHRDEDVRMGALLYLRGYSVEEEGWIKERYILRDPGEVLPVVEKLSQDSSWKVRRCAIETLGYKKFSASLALLFKALQDPNEEVAYEAAWSLQKQGKKDGCVVAARNLDNPKKQRRAIVLLRGIFRQNFGLNSSTTDYQLVIIARRWKAYLRSQGWIRDGEKD